jgi:DNA-binding MarR family transcriptional regulator
MNCPIDKENLSLTFLFTMYLKSQNQYYKHFFKDIEVTVPQYPILLKLLNHGYVYQKDISRDLHIDNALLTRNLRKLEDNGYIMRIEDNDNRRQNKISLTDKGIELANQIRDAGIKREEEIIKNSAYSRDELLDLLLELIENSDKYNKEKIIEE